jgi:hypothetical protein
MDPPLAADPTAHQPHLVVGPVRVLILAFDVAPTAAREAEAVDPLGVAAVADAAKIGGVPGIDRLVDVDQQRPVGVCAVLGQVVGPRIAGRVVEGVGAVGEPLTGDPLEVGERTVQNSRRP